MLDGAPELALLRHPFAVYGALARAERDTGVLALVRRPLLVCLVLGLSIALGATGRASLGLVLGTALCWSFAPAVQLIGLAAVARALAPERARPFSSAADLFFMGHLPWSLWLLLVGGASALTFPEGAAGVPGPLRALITLSALAPLLGTVVLTFAFWREVLALARPRAAVATLAYHALVWGFGLAYAAIVAGLWPRLLAP